MINVSVEMQSGRAVIVVEGHAGYAPNGQDIVCAAVSAIVQTSVLGLEAIADQYPDHVQVRYGGAEQEAGLPDTTGTPNGGGTNASSQDSA